MRWFGRRRLPASLRPALARGERVVAWAYDADGGAVVATSLGLFLPGEAARVGWHEIHHAAWDGERLTVVPAEVREDRPADGAQFADGAQPGDDARPGYQVTADLPQRALVLPAPGTLPRVVRARVTGSVSYSSHHSVPGGGVRVVARRVPGVDGLRWTVRYDPGTDPADQDVRSHTDALVAQAAAAHDGPAPDG